MKIEFFGVRGSIATAGHATQRYGGNTSCVYVELENRSIVFDAGTGIRALGERLMGCDRPIDVDLFFSHLHWDHIQGFPFFAPAFVPGNRIAVHGVRHEPGADSTRAVLEAQMRAPNFPVSLDIMAADLVFEDLERGSSLEIEDAVVRHAVVDHPNGCVAYRVDHEGTSMVYATDLEHGAHPSEALVELARGADLLIYDAMYTPEEYQGVQGPSRVGWGHSTYEAGAALAESARVSELCLFHHDPSHDDAFMDALGARARRRYPNTSIAREGMVVAL